MTDQERERHIASCGRLIEVAMGNYAASGNFHDIADAHAWRLAMESAINGRSAAQVARMEEEMEIS